jgi:predicted RNase H-like HicB family nuclease
MAYAYYPAIIEQAATGFSVFFPDLPGCVSGGDTASAAARNAEEALGLHLEGMTEDGDALPIPTDINAIPRDPECVEVCRLLVRAELPGRSLRVNISMDEGLLSAVDQTAKARGMNRSAFIAEGARRLIRTA